MFENDLLSFNGTPRRRPPHDRGSRAATPSPSSRSAISRACRPPCASARLPAPSASSTSCRSWLRSPDGLLQRLARQPGRHRPRRRRPARAGRARRQPRPAGRLRGAGLGPAHQRLPRRLGGGAPRRPSRRRPGARYLPHPGARHRSLRHPRHPARPHLPGPGRRRAAGSTWTTCRGAGTSAIFPARATFRSIDFMDALPPPASTGCSRWRSSTTSSARARRAGRDRRPSLAASILLDQLRARSGQVVAGLTPMPARAKCLGVEFIEFAIDDSAAVAFEQMLLGSGLSPGRPAHLQAGHAMVSGRHQHRGQHREGRLRPLLQHHARHVGLRARPARRRCRCHARSRPAPARPAVPPGRRAGRAGDSRRCAAWAAA